MTRLLGRLVACAALAGEGRPLAGAVAPLPSVLLHRLVDEVVDAALELARHLLERLPEHVTTLEAASAFLIRVRAHLALATARFKLTRSRANAQLPARHRAGRSLAAHFPVIDGTTQYFT
jgi:hypothetical protein